MCGRFSLIINDLESISDRFHVDMPYMGWKPRYNIAPAQAVLSIISFKNKRQILPMTWGLIPHWSKQSQTNYNLINARCETLTLKPSFKHCLEKQRCLIPADGFFEWKKTSSGKIPFRAVLKHENIFAFAGLWDRWQDNQGKWVYSFTLITTTANELIAPIHNRMPVILSPTAEEKWMDPELIAVEHLEALLLPYPACEMEVYPVSSLVNSWKNDGPECILRSSM